MFYWQEKKNNINIVSGLWYQYIWIMNKYTLKICAKLLHVQFSYWIAHITQSFHQTLFIGFFHVFFIFLYQLSTNINELKILFFFVVINRIKWDFFIVAFLTCTRIYTFNIELLIIITQIYEHDKKKLQFSFSFSLLFFAKISKKKPKSKY